MKSVAFLPSRMWPPKYHGAAVLFLGMLFSLGFAPLFWWPFSLIALCGLFYYAKTAGNIKQAALAGFLFGLGHHITGLYWMVRAFYVEFGNWLLALPVGALAVLVVATYLALYIALVCAVWRAIKWPKWMAPIAFAALWVTAEWLRSVAFYGFPWNLAGYVWAGHLPMMQLAAYGDVWLLSFFVVLSATILFRHSPAMLVLLLMIWGFGQWRLSENPTPEKVGLTITIVQANIAEAHKWDVMKRWQQLSTHTLLTEKHNRPDSDVIIWPETAIPFFITNDMTLRQDLAEVLYPEQLLVTGVPRKIEHLEAMTEYYNSMITMDHRAHIIDIYDKQNLVPFGEFVPLRRFMPSFIDKFVQNYADFNVGQTSVTLHLKDNKTALPLICYEAIFPQFVKKHMQDQDFILNITNDAWFDGTSSPAQHYAMARVRAVATKKPLVRVANSGISAIIDGYGREITTLPEREKRIVTTSF